MIFQSNSRGSLELLTNFPKSPLKWTDSVPTLWGECGKNKISIFNPFVTNIQMGLSQTNTSVKMAFSEYWEGGIHFKNREDVKFRNVSFGINNLELWHDVKSYDISFSRIKKETKLSFQHPKEIELFEDDLVKIFLGYNVYGPTQELGQTEISIKQSSRIIIKTKRGRLLPFYGECKSFQYYMKMIYCFLGLMIGENVFIYDINGVVKKAQKRNGKIIRQSISAKRYWRQQITEKHLKKLSYLDIPLPFLFIEEILKSSISEFNKFYPKIARFVLELIDYQNRHHPIDHHLLSQFVFLLEGLIPALYPDETQKCHQKYLLENKYEKNKQEVLDKLDGKLKRWAQNAFTVYPRFRDYYTVAINISEDVFPYMRQKGPKGDRKTTFFDDMFEYLRAERNKVAHSANGIEANVQLYFHVIRWMHLLMITLIWKRCGIGGQVLTERFWYRHPNYGHSKYVISSLLPETADKIRVNKKAKKKQSK